MVDATPLRLGVAGLGRAFSVMLPTFTRHPAVRLVAAADTRTEARKRFAEEFSAKAYDTVAALCADPAVDAVYVATPHQFHREHATQAAAAGKHLLIEKPMALTVEDCTAIADAARRAGVHVVVGHSHSFDAPVQHLRKLIEDGTFGKVRMINALNYTDYLYRPRRPEELDTSKGGGAIFNQAAHQVDMVRLLAGAPVSGVRAVTGSWDATRPTEGAYVTLLTFANGAFASLVYSGYGGFDSDEFEGWVGEMGQIEDALCRTVAPAFQDAGRGDGVQACPQLRRRRIPSARRSGRASALRHFPGELRARRPATGVEGSHDLSGRIVPP